jgi:addiction module RelE/StbE family toxin
MIIQYLPKLKKQYKKLPIKFQKEFDNRFKLFIANPTSPQLRIHPLKGNYAGYWSMNVNGDIRALYLVKGENIIIFALIGSHSELYG